MIDRNYLVSQQQIEQELDEALGEPKLVRYYYEGETDLKVIGWNAFCLQIINIDKMGKLYGIKLGSFCFYFRFNSCQNH